MGLCNVHYKITVLALTIGCELLLLLLIIRNDNDSFHCSLFYFFKAHNVFFFLLYSIIFLVNGEKKRVNEKKNVECRIEGFFRFLYFISTVNTHTHTNPN